MEPLSIRTPTIWRCLTGDELQQNMQRWLSPPDPWKNHSIARESQHSGTATWWIHGETFSKWKSSGPSSLLWLHGKRTSFVLFIRSLGLIIFTSVAGAGKSVLWYANLSVFSFINSIGAITQFLNHPRHPRHVRVRTGIARILLL